LRLYTHTHTHTGFLIGKGKKYTKYYIICCIISFLATYSITYILKSSTEQYPISNSILAILVFIAIFFVIKCSIEVANKRLVVISTFFGMFFSICLNLGTNVYKYDKTGINNLSTTYIISFANDNSNLNSIITLLTKNK